MSKREASAAKLVKIRRINQQLRDDMMLLAAERDRWQKEALRLRIREADLQWSLKKAQAWPWTRWWWNREERKTRASLEGPTDA